MSTLFSWCRDDQPDLWFWVKSLWGEQSAISPDSECAASGYTQRLQAWLHYFCPVWPQESDLQAAAAHLVLGPPHSSTHQCLNPNLHLSQENCVSAQVSAEQEGSVFYPGDEFRNLEILPEETLSSRPHLLWPILTLLIVISMCMGVATMHNTSEFLPSLLSPLLRPFPFCRSISLFPTTFYFTL